MLEVNALCCVRGEREIIRNLSFAVGDGQWAHVRGENGAGKTTLLKALTGLLRPASGTVTWNNQPIDKEREDYHRSLAYLGHSNALKDDMDAEENLQIACAIAGAPPVRPVAEALRLLGLNPANRSPMRALSQGQKRRVALARLALTPARLWILDEPLAALDTAAMSALCRLMDAHLAAGGSLVLTSHQPVELAQPPIDIRPDATSPAAGP